MNLNKVKHHRLWTQSTIFFLLHLCLKSILYSLIFITASVYQELQERACITQQKYLTFGFKISVFVYSRVNWSLTALGSILDRWWGHSGRTGRGSWESCPGQRSAAPPRAPPALRRAAWTLSGWASKHAAVCQPAPERGRGELLHALPEGLEAVWGVHLDPRHSGCAPAQLCRRPRELVRSTEARAPLRPAEETSPGDVRAS